MGSRVMKSVADRVLFSGGKQWQHVFRLYARYFKDHLAQIEPKGFYLNLIVKHFGAYIAWLCYPVKKGRISAKWTRAPRFQYMFAFLSWISVQDTKCTLTLSKTKRVVDATSKIYNQWASVFLWSRYKLGARKTFHYMNTIFIGFLPNSWESWECDFWSTGSTLWVLVILRATKIITYVA